MEIAPVQARLLRMQSQRLLPSPESPSAVSAVARDVCGVQAQDRGQAALGVRARSTGLTASDVLAARVEDRTVVRTYAMRCTLHLVATEDLPWLLALFGLLYVKRGKRRLANAGLEEEDCVRAVGLIRDAIADRGALTRPELAQALLEEGFDFDPSGPASFRLVRRACLEGAICRAGFRDGSETYAALGEWTGLDLDLGTASYDGAALAALARRYLAAYQPATVDDFHKWSGLYKKDAAAGWNAIRNERTEIAVSGEPAWILRSAESTLGLYDAAEIGEPMVGMLPMYDSYLLGHRSRDLILAERYTDRVQPRSTEIRATVLVDGRVSGIWKFEKFDRSRGTGTVHVTPFEPIGEAVRAGMEREVEDIGRFLGSEFDMRVGDPVGG